MLYYIIIHTELPGYDIHALYACNYYIYRHGIIRMEFHILNDQELSFQDIMKRHLSGEKMVDAKEKRLYEEMRLNAANARKELVKDEKEEVKKSKEETKEDETSESKKDTTEEKQDEVTKEETIESDTKQDEVKEEDKEDKVTTDKLESLETDEKDSLDEKAEEEKPDSGSKEELNKDDKEDETLKKKKLKGKLKKGKKRGPGRPPKNLEKDNPFVEDDFDDVDGMYLEDIDDDGAPITPKVSLEKQVKRKPGRPPGRPKKQVEPLDEFEGKRSTRSDLKMIPFDGCPSKGSVSLTPVKKSSDQESPQKRKGGFVNVSIDPPQISLQQMEQMARGGVYDMDMMTDLMQQTYAAAIKWPKDRILTIRLEHIMEAVETDKWPVSKEFSYAEAAQLTIPESPAATEGVAVTPMRDTPTPAMSEVSEVSNPYEDSNVLTPGRKHGNRGRKPLGAGPSLHSPEIMDKSSKIRSLLTAGHQGRQSQVENEEIR